MEYRRFDRALIVRLDKGEEIISSLSEVCRNENISFGKISGIGAVDSATVGLFDPEAQIYHSVELKGDFEITSLTGNITSFKNDIYLHLHINLAGSDHIVKGGHLNDAVVSATAEIIIDIFDGKMERVYEDEAGLNLLDFRQ